MPAHEHQRLPALDMPLEEAMRTHRSIRRLRNDPVDDAYGPTTRRPVGDVVSPDRYGNRAYR